MISISEPHLDSAKLGIEFGIMRPLMNRVLLSISKRSTKKTFEATNFQVRTSLEKLNASQKLNVY